MTAKGAVRLVLATRNAGKIREIEACYAHLPVSWLALADVSGAGEVAEEGETYAENAAEKARAAAEASGYPAIADDSGIEVDALAGAPGVRSARFLGKAAADADRNARILALLQDTPETDRGARFVAAVAVALPGGDLRIFEGACAGRISRRAQGSGGFGYDPIFVPEGENRTMAELPAEVKNRISHRARALKAAESYVAALASGPLQDRRSKSAN